MTRRSHFQGISLLKGQGGLLVFFISAYVLAFLISYPTTGAAIAALSIVPVIAAGWLYGLRGGFLLGVLAFPTNTLLLNLVGKEGWDAVIRTGAIPGYIAIMLVAVIVGRLRDLGDALRQEVHERELAEQALQESAERFHTLTEGALAGVYIIQDGLFRYVNPTLAQIFGYSPNEITDHLGPLDLTYSEDQPLVTANIQQRLAGATETVHYSFRGRHKNSTVIECETLGRRAEYKRRPAIVGTLLDITEHKQMESQRLELALSRERAAANREFVDMVSHDLKAPLTVINTSLYLLTKITDPAQQRERIERITGQVHRLETLIQDMLVVSRLDAVPEGEFHPLSMQPLIMKIHEAFQVVADDRHITLKVNADTAIPDVLADDVELERALTNLVQNALRYTADGGNVTIQLYVDTGQVVVAVSDSGMGIAEADLPYIFDPFYRAENARKTDAHGTGLGLAIVKRVIEMHQGSIEVESTLGRGSTFRVRLPICLAEETSRIEAV